MYPRSIKRVFDLIVGTFLLIFLSPLISLVIALVWLKLGAPVIFRQTRPGIGGRPFTLLKIRTMKEIDADSGDVASDEVRITRIGRFLRSTSLDELPELVNVLKGEMSMVGPRPLLMRYLERYSPDQFRRHEVKPGITGWAQINGRNTLTWEEKFQMDVWYVDHVSLSLDLRILAMTVWKTLTREGINQRDHATAPEFLGSQADVTEHSTTRG